MGKRSPASSAIREMQIKATLRVSLGSVRWLSSVNQRAGTDENGWGREDSPHATGGNLHEAAPGCMGLHEAAWGNSVEVTRNAEEMKKM